MVTFVTPSLLYASQEEIMLKYDIFLRYHQLQDLVSEK